MSDTATPNAGAESLSEEGVIGSLNTLFSDTPKAPKAEAPKQEAVEESEAAQPDELSADDLPEDDGESEAEAPDDGTYELIHNGTPVKVSRAEVIQLGQKGFDYDRKMGAVAETQRQFSDGLRRLAEVEQVQPMLMQELAAVVSMQQQLQQYQNIDWERLAADDPLGYPQHQARFMKLQGQTQQAAQLLQQKVGVVQQYRDGLNSTLLQQEHARLAEVVPAWKDQAKLDADKGAMGKYLQTNGLDPAQVGSKYLDNAFAMKVLRQSMLYEQLQKAKTDKSKQLRTAPPVIRPGANVPSDRGRANTTNAIQAIRKAGRQGNHSAQEKMMEGLLGKAYK